MTKISTLHKRWMKNPDYKSTYESLESEFLIAAQTIMTNAERALKQEHPPPELQTSQLKAASEGGDSLLARRPNARTIAAMKEGRKLDGKPGRPIEELFYDLERVTKRKAL